MSKICPWFAMQFTPVKRIAYKRNVSILGSRGVLDIQIGCDVLCCNIRQVKIVVTYFNNIYYIGMQ
jgi:hypothetical protein